MERSRSRHISSKTKRAVIKRDGQICQVCGECVSTPTMGHIKAFSKGGSNTTRNLTVCCLSCNSNMGNEHMDRYIFRKRIQGPRYSKSLERVRKYPGILRDRKT